VEDPPGADSTRYQPGSATDELHIPPLDRQSAKASGTFVPPYSAIPPPEGILQPL